jgi:SAM-dependent methyltransferase
VSKSWNDPSYVRAQYATETGLEARRSAYKNAVGPDARDVVVAAVAEVTPQRVLEVGPGPGELSERLARELGVTVVAIDSSERMVELAVSRGVDARLGDVQSLDLPAESFDCAIAAWMLYHVPDLDRGLAEISRVLRPGGRLVAVTNAVDHLLEVWQLVGADHMPLPFGAENGEEALRRHFARVERRDVEGTTTFPHASAVRGYLGSFERGVPLARSVPAVVPPLVARRRVAVFVADKQ